ncbi:MAG TPA: hypothetical protein VHZ97_17025 [Pseudonocardiaceae bacterium]|nr:hypothetical protein [Pseudonocardiaceae bacterium]
MRTVRPVRLGAGRDGDRGSGRLAVGRGAVAEAGEEFGAELGGHRLGMELQAP